MSSLKEMRELSRSLHNRKQLFQKEQHERKIKEQSRLHEEALRKKDQFRSSLGSSTHIHVENFFSQIPFQYIGIAVLLAVVAAECFYLHSQGIISAPGMKAKYEVSVSNDQDFNTGIASTVGKLVQDIRSDKSAAAQGNLFNTDNQDKISRFIKETSRLDVRSVVYAKGEKCYYASALNDSDRSVSFKLDRIDGSFKVTSIDIED